MEEPAQVPDGPLRLFVALLLPADVRGHLAAAVDAARVAGTAVPGPPLRWSAPPSWHLTLVFCGSVPPGKVAELEKRLARAAARHPSARLRVEGADRFGHRVLWAGVGGERDRVVALAASAAAAARRTGIPVEDRPYRPHLTLARGAPGADLRPYVEALTSCRGPDWVADSLSLVRSRLGAGPGGAARYDVLRSWPLSA